MEWDLEVKKHKKATSVLTFPTLRRFASLPLHDDEVGRVGSRCEARATDVRSTQSKNGWTNHPSHFCRHLHTLNLFPSSQPLQSHIQVSNTPGSCHVSWQNSCPRLSIHTGQRCDESLGRAFLHTTRSSHHHHVHARPRTSLAIIATPSWKFCADQSQSFKMLRDASRAITQSTVRDIGGSGSSSCILSLSACVPLRGRVRSPNLGTDMLSSLKFTSTIWTVDLK